MRKSNAQGASAPGMEDPSGAEAKLQDLKQAMDQVVIMAVTDPEGHILEVNQAFCEISGYGPEALIGQDHRILNSGHHSQSFFSDLWATIQSGRVWRGEIRNRAKDGHFYWVDTVIVPRMDAEGRPRSYTALRLDITGKKEAEAQAAESLRLLNSLVEGTEGQRGRAFLQHFAGHVQAALGVRWVMVAEFLDDLPVRARIVAGRDGHEGVEPFTYELKDAPCEGVAQGRICFYPDRVCEKFPEDRILTEMGSEAFLGIPICNKGDKPIGVLAVLDDRPMVEDPALRSVLKVFAARAGAELERMQADRALQSSEARLALALDSAQAGLWEWDLATDQMSGNLRTEVILGLDSLQGASWRSRLHPEDGKSLDRDLADHLSGADPIFAAKIRVQSGSGSWIHLRLRGQVVAQGPLGEPLRMTGILTDVTEQLRQHESFLETQKLESLGLLAAGVAHDFNNLLQAVLGHDELAEAAFRRGQDPSRHLARIRETAERALELIRQLLDYAGKEEGDPVPLDLRALVMAMAGIVKVAIPRGIQLVLEEGAGPLRIDGIPSKLQQVVLNLVTNAADALGDRAGTISIRIAACLVDETTLARLLPGLPLGTGPHALLEVRDTGGGMDSVTLKRIFEPFFTTKQTGRGLGLAAMLGIIRSHRGGLEVESQLGAGTCFRVYLPLCPENGGKAGTG